MGEMTEITKDDMTKSLARRNAQLAEYAALPPIQPQLQRMHAAYTAKPEAKCGDCQACRKLKANGRLTCEVYLHETHKPAYWLEDWTACGMSEPKR